MKLSKTKIYNFEKVINDKFISTTDLLEKSGYIKQIQSGLFVQMNFAKLVINNIEKIIKAELNKIGALEIGLNQLQSAEIWKQTGRFDTYGNEMFKVKDRSNKDMVFTGTNEELVTLVAKDYIRSYKDLTFNFYQINNKFRDEIRCNNGLIRSKEFLMMDSYSFHENKECLEKYYVLMKECYKRIFDKLKLNYKIEKADSGEIGGSISEEFIIETSEGEIEIGHIFQLDTKYSEQLGTTYLDNNNKKNNVFMGCYGIGISRLFHVLADVKRDNNYFNFDSEISAYKYVIIVGNVNNKQQLSFAKNMYNELYNKEEAVYLDDRDIRIGEKLKEADTLGISNKILIGNNISKGYYEIKKKSNDNWNKFEF